MSSSRRVIIRIATCDDVEDLFDIRTSVRENHQSREELHRIGVTAESVCASLTGESRGWIATVDGVPAAFTMALGEERTVFAMFVRPRFDGLGLGRALMAEAERWLFDRGAGEIWLTTGNDRALRAYGFYLKLGWMEDTVTPSGERRFIKRRPQRR